MGNARLTTATSMEYQTICLSVASSPLTTGIIGMPTVILFDPQGKEIRRFSGFLEAREFLDLLRP